MFDGDRAKSVALRLARTRQLQNGADVRFRNRTSLDSSREKLALASLTRANWFFKA